MGVSASSREAFDQEILPHLDLLYRVALRYAREPARAEDLVQDTLLKAFRSWEKFQPGTSARAWLLAIMRNTFINLYRREKREPIALDPGGAGTGMTWIPSGAPTASARLRVTAIDAHGAVGADASDGPFAIAAPPADDDGTGLTLDQDPAGVRLRWVRRVRALALGR